MESHDSPVNCDMRSHQCFQYSSSVFVMVAAQLEHCQIKVVYIKQCIQSRIKIAVTLMHFQK